MTEPASAAAATGGLGDRAATSIPGDPSAGEVAREQLDRAKAGSAALSDFLYRRPGLDASLAGIFSNSPFLRETGCRVPERLHRVLTAPPETTCSRLAADLAARYADETGLRRALRLARQEAALAVGLADLLGVWSLDEVTGCLSTFAEAAVRAAVRWLLLDADDQGQLRLADRDDPEAGSGLIVLAMGKLGAFELNYSSDIDVIVFYDQRIAPFAGTADPDKFYPRFAQRLSKILQERTAEGYVFRVDLRLRPDPGATPAAIRADTAVHYYRTRGRSWERAAFIKARQVAGDDVAGRILMRAIRPFVWRRQFDFSAVDDVESVKRQIDVVRGHGDITLPGHNVKLGRGGIREIEFIVQTSQLIAGGRDPQLRDPRTLSTLSALARSGWLDGGYEDDLSPAYVFLRDVEHTLQMISDEQTHTLPDSEAGLARVGRLRGFSDPEAFRQRLLETLRTIRRRYEEFFTAPRSDPSLRRSWDFAVAGDGELGDALSEAGYRDPDAVLRIFRGWLAGGYQATRSERAREILRGLLPEIAERLATTDNADAAVVAFDVFLSQLPAGVQFFSMLKSHPQLLGLLATIMGAAPRLSEILTRRSRVLDVLLDPQFFGTLADKANLKQLLNENLAEADCYEEFLDRLRIFGQEQRFLISVRILTGSMSPYDAGVSYSRLADVLIRRTLAEVRAVFEERHGRVPGGEIAILALGKLGGREMTARSDLDLIVLYDHAPDAAASDGEKPLAPSQYFIRLTQRLVAALAAPTAQGSLYDVDFRLRPSGNSGPLATRLSSFESYQSNDAWTWEHMALTRARAVAGDPALVARADAIIRRILCTPRDRDRLFADIREMRARLEREKPAKSPWQIKTVAGGLIDLEFMAQALQLAYAAATPALLACNTLRVFEAARQAGHVSEADYELLNHGVTLYQSLSQILALALDGEFDPTSAPGGLRRLLRRAGDAPDFAHLEADLTQTEISVRRRFEKLVPT